MHARILIEEEPHYERGALTMTRNKKDVKDLEWRTKAREPLADIVPRV